jgi:hypothetical protein
MQKEVEMTLADVMRFVQAASSIPEGLLSNVVTIFRIATNLRTLEDNLKVYNQQRDEWIKELGKKNEQGNFEIDAKSDARHEFAERQNKLLATTVTVKLQVLPLSELVDEEKPIPLGNVHGILPMIVED